MSYNAYEVLKLLGGGWVKYQVNLEMSYNAYEVLKRTDTERLPLCIGLK